MNKNILELAKEAGFDLQTHNGFGGKPLTFLMVDSNNAQANANKLEKFVELIIHDCLRECDIAFHEMRLNMQIPDKCLSSGALYAGHLIQEQFEIDYDSNSK
jgi:hypothetical protein